MNRSSRSVGAVVAAAAMLVILPLPPAHAAAAGKLAVLPARGTDRSALTLVTANACPSGTNVLARIEGAGFLAGGQNVVGNSAITAYDRTRTGGIRIPLSLVLRDIANLPAKPVVYHGSYRVTVVCRDRVRIPELGRFTTTITFTDTTHYRTTNPAIATAVAPPEPGSGPAGPGVPNGAGASAAPGSGGTQQSGSTGSVTGSEPLANASAGGSDWVRWLGLGVLGLGVLGLGAGASSRFRGCRRPSTPQPTQAVPPHREKVT
jgi:hypothetical protein